MNSKGTFLFVFGLLALSLAAVEHATAKVGAVAAEPIACDYVDLGDVIHTPRSKEGVEKYFSAEAAKGMRFTTFANYGRTDVPPALPPTPTTLGIPQPGVVAVFCSR